MMNADQWDAADILTKARTFIALGKNGYPFVSYACSQIMDLLRLKKNLNRECCYWILRSAMARHDDETALMFVRDWMDEGQKPTVVVKKFRPGEHYHVLGKKFDTFWDATQYLEAQGYRYGGRQTIDVTQGD